MTVNKLKLYDRRGSGGDESKKTLSLSVPKRPSMKVVNDIILFGVTFGVLMGNRIICHLLPLGVTRIVSI